MAKPLTYLKESTRLRSISFTFLTKVFYTSGAAQKTKCAIIVLFKRFINLYCLMNKAAQKDKVIGQAQNLNLDFPLIRSGIKRTAIFELKIAVPCLIVKNDLKFNQTT